MKEEILMLHENIKELARRSLIADKVMFGESRKAHPLGFDGFMVDATVDRALLQLNSSVYDSATSLQIECGNIVSMLKESLNVNVSTGVARLYKESKVGEVFKKVIAYIKKALNFLFVELPKKIYNKIKSFFTKKKDSTGMAKKTAENIKKTEESLKAVQKEAQSKMAEMAEVLNEMHDTLKASKKKTDESMKNMQATKATVGSNITARHAEAKDTIQKSMANIHANLETIDENKGKSSDKTGKVTKGTRAGGNAAVSDALKEIDDIGKELDDLLNSTNNDTKYDNSDTMKYRNAELKMMADTLLSSIEGGKVKLNPTFLKDIGYFRDSYMPLIVNDSRNEFGSSDHFDLFAINMLVRSADAIPYTTPTLAKYFKEKFKVEIFNPFDTATMAPKQSVAVAYMVDQLKSVNRLCDSLKMHGMPTFDVEIFNTKYISAFSSSLRRQDATKHRISLDTLQSISHELTTVHKNADISTLKNLEKPYAELYDAVKNMNMSIMFMKGMSFEDVAEYIGVEASADNTAQINEGMANILELIKVVMDSSQKIAVASMRCMYSLVSAEEKIVKFVVSNDDFVSSVTMSQLAHFISNDMPSVRRAWKIIHAQ